MADPKYDFCVDCMEEFRYDDCGGYNPPCECGYHCESCHERELRDVRDDDERYPDYPVCDTCGDEIAPDGTCGCCGGFDESPAPTFPEKAAVENPAARGET